MIDGQVTGEFSMSKLSADKINSISAYKDIESIKLQGEKGKNGVIVLVTKKEQVGLAYFNSSD